MAEILKTFPINLDMKRVTAQSTPIPPLVVDDTGNVFEITLTDGGVPVDLRECWVFAQFSLPDGTTSSRSTEDAEDPIVIDGDAHNVIKLRLNNVNYTAGKNNCEVEVYSGEGHSTLVTSANFNFDARAKIVNSETAQRDPSFPFLLGLIEQVDGALDKLDDAVTAEEDRVAAEQERVEAETEREQKVDEVYQAYESGALKGDKGDQGNAGKDGKDGKVQSIDGVQPNSDGTLTLSAVRYASQTLTADQQAQARDNIKAAGLDANGKVEAEQTNALVVTHEGLTEYTISAADMGKFHRFLIADGTTATCNVTLPDDGGIIPIGSEIEIMKMNSGLTLNVVCETDVYIYTQDKWNNSTISLDGAYGLCALKKMADNRWVARGDIA